MSHNKRNQRIMKIVSIIQEKDLPKSFPLYDIVFKHCKSEYPTMTKRTLKDYTDSAIFVLRQRGYTG